MNPTNVPDEVLEQAKLVRAQLLLHMHTPNIIQKMQETYDVIIEIQSMQTGRGRLFVQVDLLDIHTEQEVTMFFCLAPKSDIVQQLTEKVEEDIDALYDLAAQNGCHSILTTIEETPETDEEMVVAPF